VKRLLEPEQLDAEYGSDARALLVHVASAPAYATGHIAGAVHVAPAELVSGEKPATGKLPERGRLEALFARIGYRPDARIVVYDDEGGGWAGRFIWTLDVIGHADWYYLNGGVHAWQAVGLPLVQADAIPTPRPVTLSIDRAPIAETEEILARLGAADLTVWDCRSREEYDGRRVSAARAGHIPGAVHLDWLELMDPDRALRLRRDLPALLQRHGITAARELIVHCQTHHRSGLAYLVARLLDFPRVKGYHGSWAEWGNRDDTPIESSA
jgi:thiosulfate/3-mercaptopyruvate sulfurtransferase